MLRDRLQTLVQSVREVIRNPREATSRWQRTVRFTYDLGRYGARQLREIDAAVMAAALTFRTLFALLPVIVVTAVVIKAMYGIEEFKKLVGQLVDSFGLDDVQVVSADVPMVEDPSLEEPAASAMSLGEWVEDLVEQAAGMHLEALGWVGLAIVIYAAIALMVTIENVFNTICRAPQGRSWTWRVPMYWFMLTLSPVAIGLTFYIDGRLSAWIQEVAEWQWLLRTGPILWSFCATWLLLTAVYMLVPNTTVGLRPALIGAFFGAVLVEIGKHTLGAYISNAFTISQLYGSLGLIPVFMFWVYLMWLFVLYGLQICATLRMLGDHALEPLDPQRRPKGVFDPMCVLAVMQSVGRHFEESKPASVSDIRRDTEFSDSLIRLVIAHLTEAGYVHEVSDAGRVLGGTAVTLARRPEQIMLDDLLKAGYDLVDSPASGSMASILEPMRRKHLESVKGKSLGDVLKEG